MLVCLGDGSPQKMVRADTVMEVADQTFYLTQSRYTDTRQPVLALTLAKRNFQRDLTDTNMLTDSDLLF